MKNIYECLKRGFAEMRKPKVARMSPYWCLQETH